MKSVFKGAFWSFVIAVLVIGAFILWAAKADAEDSTVEAAFCASDKTTDAEAINMGYALLRLRSAEDDASAVDDMFKITQMIVTAYNRCGVSLLRSDSTTKRILVNSYIVLIDSRLNTRVDQ
jgi:hypothetical protein